MGSNATGGDSDYSVRFERAIQLMERGQAVHIDQVFGADPAVRARGAADLRLLTRLGIGLRAGAIASRGSAEVERAGERLLAGRYDLLQELGTGGFGEVWLAADRQLGRLVALKSLRRDLPDKAQVRLRDSLLQDGRSLASVRHPNIVHVNDVFEVDGRLYLCLEYVPGESLGSVIEFGVLHWSDALRYVADVGEALRAVHSVGLVHRDVKPRNILWDSGTDEVKLTDFGLAVRCGEPSGPGGTPLFMAPEAFEGKSGIAGDVYSLGATLFMLLCGEPPFPGKERVEVWSRQRTGLAPSDERWKHVPVPCRHVLAASLALDPGARPALTEFVARCRGALNQNLVPTPAATEPSDALAIRVSRAEGQGKWTAIADAGASLPVGRDILPVASYQLATGDRVRVDVRCARAGHLAVLAIGPTGTLHLLHPRVGSAWANVRAGENVTVADLQVVLPAGRERINVLWCRHPRPLDLDDLRALSSRSGEGSPEHRATRDIVHLQAVLGQLAQEDWGIAGVELDHRETA